MLEVDYRMKLHYSQTHHSKVSRLNKNFLADEIVY